VTNARGDTALHVACKHKKGTGIVQALLLASDAVVNVADVCGDTPLHLACRSGHMSAVQALLEKGARVNVTSADGTSVTLTTASLARRSA
jgi:ankyrin repeat protein